LTCLFFVSLGFSFVGLNISGVTQYGGFVSDLSP
jgi:hypothetical protein